MKSAFERGNEPWGSTKCWNLPSGCTTFGLSSSAQLHRVSLLVSKCHAWENILPSYKFYT
jgi:hypothetical protein